MKTHIINTCKQLYYSTQHVDFISTLKSTEWIVYNDNVDEVEKLFFVSNDKLLSSVNGRSQYYTWNFVKINKSLVIDYGNIKYLFKIIAFDKNIVVLNIDSTNSYVFLTNSNTNVFKENPFENIQWYLARNCGIDILTSEQRAEYKKEQDLQRRKLEYENKKVQEQTKKDFKVLFIIIGIFIGLYIAIICIKDYNEYKKLHPTITVTKPENRVAVDLGLSVKWASCNVGANSPEEYGNYYGWGDPTGQDIYSNEPEIEKECRFPKRDDDAPPVSIVNSNFDIVKQNWGGKWRMPTKKEIEELIDNCKVEHLEFINGVKCAKLVGPNGNFIYLPFAGLKKGSDGVFAKNSIYLWSGDLDTIEDFWFTQQYPVSITHSYGAVMLSIQEEYKNGSSTGKISVNIEEMDRFEDLPVRGVMK